MHTISPRSSYLALVLVLLAACKSGNKRIDCIAFIPHSVSQIKSAGFSNMHNRVGVMEGAFTRGQEDTLIEIYFYSAQKGDFFKILHFPGKMKEKEVRDAIAKRANQVLLQDDHAVLIKQDGIFFNVQAVALQGNRMQVTFLSFNTPMGKQRTKEYWYYSLQRTDSVNYKLQYNTLIEKLEQDVKE